MLYSAIAYYFGLVEMKGTGKKSKGKRKVSDLKGNLRQKTKDGSYYYRLTIANGRRKEFALKTADLKEASKKAAEIDSVWLSPTADVALAQISAIKGFSRQAQNISFDAGWEKYSIHPNRAKPHTVSEQGAYKSTYEEFVSYVTNPKADPENKNHIVITGIGELSSAVCEEFASYLKKTHLAVDTHNRKIKRLRKIFGCLGDYYEGENPFRAPSLLRSEREEQNEVVRRKAFTKKEEQKLLEVLSDTTHKVINKHEIRIVYIIGMFTGQRLKDCVLLQWQNIDMEHKRIWVQQSKTGKQVIIPMAPELFAALKEAEEWRIDQYVTPKTAARYNKCNSDGKNVGNNLVDIDVLRVIRWIGLEPSVDVPGRNKKMTVYGFHSLRHSFASFCAEAGIPKAVLLSILGTDSDIADKYYTHVGEESQRKAIEAISGRISEKSPQDKIDEVLALLDAKPEPSNELLEKISEILK